MPDTATITDVRRTPAGRHVVVLATGGHEIPIWIGASEADALVLAVAADLPIEVDPAVVAATRDRPPERYAEDLDRSAPGGTTLIADEVRTRLAAQEAERQELLASD